MTNDIATVGSVDMCDRSVVEKIENGTEGTWNS